MSVAVSIRKQRLRIRAASPQAALQVRKHMNASWQYALVSMMERVFDTAAQGIPSCEIDKISIDLGCITEAEFDRQFLERAETQLLVAVREQLPQKYSSNAINSSGSVTDFYGVSQANDMPASGAITTGEQLKALLHYLEYGIYPWWFTPSAMPQGEHAWEQVVQNHEREIWQFLHRQVQAQSANRSYAVVQRLSKLVTENFIAGNCTRWVEEVAAVLPTIAWKHWLRKQVASMVRPETLQLQQGRSRLLHFLLHTSSRPPDVDTTPPAEAVEPYQRAMQQQSQPAEQPADLSLPLTKQGIFIGNAGLILLHPFLRSFFESQELLNAQFQISDSHHRYKAALFIYYLQCGSTQPREWEMAFNKIMCSIPLQDSIPEMEMTASECTEADNLLLAVCQHWTALGSASIEALREAFLQRPGKLTEKDGQWLLQVERTGIDVLLDRLPWGISTVKLPWLEKIIFTEW